VMGHAAWHGRKVHKAEGGTAPIFE
jgi:hypothetical protein